MSLLKKDQKKDEALYVEPDLEEEVEDRHRVEDDDVEEDEKMDACMYAGAVSCIESVDRVYVNRVVLFSIPG